MAEKKIDQKEFTNDVLIADIMLRLTAIEKLLIEKQCLSKQELLETTQLLAKEVAKKVLEKANNSKSLDEFINNLGNSDKSDSKKN